MVARRGTNHAFFKLRGTQVRHFVVSPSKFKTENRLLVLAFEQHMVAQAFTQGFGGCQLRLVSHVIHLGI